MFSSITIVSLVLIRGVEWFASAQQGTCTPTTQEPYNWVPNGYRQGLINGSPSHISKHPWLVAIEFTPTKEIRCAGAILGINWVVTSMSCLFLYERKDLHVRVGSEFGDSGGQRIAVKDIIRHLQNDGTWRDDLALLKLQQDIVLGDFAKVIEIGPAPGTGTMTTVSGWGYENVEAKQLTVLEDTYPIIDYNKCFEYFEISRFSKAKRKGLTPKSVCTYKEDHVPCEYDDGNPLVYNGKLIGIYSGTAECFEAKYPGVYLQIALYTNWIDQAIRNYTQNAV